MDTCFYCQPDARRDELMIEVAHLEVSTLFLFREQTHHGRCLLAHRHHTKEVFDLDPAESEAFFRDLAKAARAIDAAVKPDKLNYGAFADKNPHLHFHIVPKFRDGPNWGSTFTMMPEPKKLLSEAEYATLVQALRSQL